MIDIENMPVILKNYMGLHNNLDIDNLIILNDIFDKIDKYELKSINISHDNLILDGILMKESKTNKIMNSKDNKYALITKYINEHINNNNINELYFYNTFIKLINKFDYITKEEQVMLNFLFEEIKEENKNLQEVNNKDKKYIIK